MTQLRPDQAEGLRRLFVADKRRMIGVLAPGRHGAAQDLSYNLAAALTGQTKKVLLVKEALSEGERCSACDAMVRYDLSTVLARQLSIESAILTSAEQVDLLAGGAGARLLPRPRMESRIGLVNDFYRLAGRYDVVLVDADSEAIHQQPSFVWACQDVIVVCDGSPGSVTSLYRHIKSLQQAGGRRFHLLFEQVEPAQAAVLFRNVAAVSRRHLQLMPEMLGVLPTSLRDVTEFYRELAGQVLAWPLPEQRTGHFPALMRRLLAGAGTRAAPAVVR